MEHSNTKQFYSYGMAAASTISPESPPISAVSPPPSPSPPPTSPDPPPDVFHHAHNQMNEDQLPKDPSNEDERTKLKKEAIVKVHFLMHAFGDANYPLNKSVLLLFELLENQMLLLIGECETLVKKKKTKEITIEEILFLMRNNKALLRRLLHFLYLKDIGKHILPGFVEYRGTKIIPQEAKTVHKCLEYLSSIEKSNGDLSYLFRGKKVFDSVLQKRLERRYLIENSKDILAQKWFNRTLAISLDNYVKTLQEVTTFDITPTAALIIEFLALETVAGIVEKALYMRSRNFEVNNKVKLVPHLDFCSILKFEDSDDDLVEDDAVSPGITNFSFIPRKYLKRKKTFDGEKFYQDSMLTVLPKVVSFPTDCNPKYLPSDFIQHSGHLPLHVVMRKKPRKDFEKELSTKNPITPEEIRAAFIHYQRCSPMTMLLNPKPPYSEMIKTKLICLALPKEEYEEA